MSSVINKKIRKIKIFWFLIPVIIMTLLVFLLYLKGRIIQSSPFSKEKALENVKSLPEVIEYLKLVPGAQVVVNGQDNDQYLVQVYEIKNGHTATFSWYEVDKITGKVKKMY